jgi:hypothetical protein
VENKTLFEAFWDNIKPGVNYTLLIKHLRIINCFVFILINKEKRIQSRKVVAKAEKGILMGFEEHNIYRYLINSKVVRIF